VRIGLGPVPLARASRAQLDELANAAVAASFDAIWVAESRAEGVGGGLAAAALLAQLVPIRVGAALDFGDYHPLYMAEDIAVADLVSSGRIEVLLRGGSPEQLRLLVAALSGAHLRFEGETLRVPARLEANQPSPQRLSLNPRPAQPVVPIWVADADPDLALEIGVGVAAGWRTGAAAPAASGRWPGMLLCPHGVGADNLLAAAGDAATYFLVEAASRTEVASAGRRLVGTLRMPELAEWIRRQ
jgi:alkanesulfonate monooxygenase SsuD/methylene tetrahydromethanopterin reductase-like flavin-dependent oxidoreductase (luciferase family)